MKWFFAGVWSRVAEKNYNLKAVGAVELFVRESLPQVYEEFRFCFVGQGGRFGSLVPGRALRHRSDGFRVWYFAPDDRSACLSDCRA
jgi:hypothetical protein